jgi:hypothetical protein
MMNAGVSETIPARNGLRSDLPTTGHKNAGFDQLHLRERGFATNRHDPRTE